MFKLCVRVCAIVSKNHKKIFLHNITSFNTNHLFYLFLPLATGFCWVMKAIYKHFQNADLAVLLSFFVVNQDVMFTHGHTSINQTNTHTWVRRICFVRHKTFRVPQTVNQSSSISNNNK